MPIKAIITVYDSPHRGSIFDPKNVATIVPWDGKDLDLLEQVAEFANGTAAEWLTERREKDRAVDFRVVGIKGRPYCHGRVIFA